MGCPFTNSFDHEPLSCASQTGVLSPCFHLMFDNCFPCPSPHFPRCDLILPAFTPYLDYFMSSMLCDIITLWPDLLFVKPQLSLTKLLLAFTWGENLHELVKVLSQPSSQGSAIFTLPMTTSHQSVAKLNRTLFHHPTLSSPSKQEYRLKACALSALFSYLRLPCWNTCSSSAVFFTSSSKQPLLFSALFIANTGTRMETPWG